MVFALHSKVVQNLAAVVEFVHSIIKTLNCCVVCLSIRSFVFPFVCPAKSPLGSKGPSVAAESGSPPQESAGAG